MKHNFKNLEIWKFGMDLTDMVYTYADALPKQERYNLISQMIRSACSVPANIAEGSAKTSDKDFKRFLEISLGSAYELETHLLICQRRKYGSQELLNQTLEKLNSEQRLLIGMIKSLRSKILLAAGKKATMLLLAVSSTLAIMQLI